MATFCHETKKWVEEKVQKPIEELEKRQEKQCREEPCNWWMLCLNKLFCWIAVIVTKIVRFILVTLGKWVFYTVCEVVSAALDAAGFLVNLILSIPILGGIIRTVLNWGTELLWRLIGLLDFGLSLAGVRWKKRMHVGLLIPRSDGKPITSEAAMLPQIEKARELYRKLCNIELIYSGACIAPVDAPRDTLSVGCNADGFFSDWGLRGSIFELSSSTCEYRDGWRRVIGLGAEIVVIPVLNVTPDSATSSTVGCSFASTHNYVVVEPSAGPAVAAHEIGHACWLSHRDDEPGNLMFPSNLATEPTLTPWQVSLVRWSKHCVYF